MSKRKRVFKLFLGICLCLGLIAVAALIWINSHMKNSVKAQIISATEASELEDADCIVVLGCQVKDNGMPSLMLRDRLDCGNTLYHLGAAPKLLMSGDHGRTEYNEVGTMKQYAVDDGIASEDIFMDHAGFSTYESIYRAKEVFGVETMIIVTQEYHLYRALYIAEKLGLEAYGVPADVQTYAGQSMRDFREILARAKDFVTTLTKPMPTYLGDKIPIDGNGDVTND